MTISKKIKLFGLLFVSLLLLHSCSSDDDAQIGDDGRDDQEEQPFKDGFFVVNEGQFPDAGTISFIANDLETSEQNVFQNANDGEEVGNTPQSMFFDEEYAYIIANGSNFIMVADRYTFKKIDTITGSEGDFSTPRYGIAVDGSAYITNGGTDNLTIVDLDDFSATKTIDLGKSAEFIHQAENGLLYIQKAAFDSGNEIAAFDPGTEEVVAEIETAEALNSIAVSEDHLYALSPEKIQKFDLETHEETGEITLDYEENPANLTIDEGQLYFTSGKKVYSLGVDEDTTPDAPLFEYESDSGFGVFYGFDVQESKIYAADGGDFASDSFIIVYDLEDESSEQFDVGVGPNGFYFNE